LDENALLLARRMDELESLPLTPDGSLDTDPVVDEIPGPGVDPLSAGLSAAAGGMEDGHEEER
jgi:hypothetical protein